MARDSSSGSTAKRPGAWLWTSRAPAPEVRWRLHAATDSCGHLARPAATVRQGERRHAHAQGGNEHFPGKERIVGVRFADLASAAFDLVPRADGLRLARGRGPARSRRFATPRRIRGDGARPAVRARCRHLVRAPAIRPLARRIAGERPAGRSGAGRVDRGRFGHRDRHPVSRHPDPGGTRRGRELADSSSTDAVWPARYAYRSTWTRGPIVTDFTRFVFDPEAVVTGGRATPHSILARCRRCRSPPGASSSASWTSVASPSRWCRPGRECSSNGSPCRRTPSGPRPPEAGRATAPRNAPRFNLRMHGDKLGDMLDSLGFDGSVGGGRNDRHLAARLVDRCARRFRARAARGRHALPVHRRAPDPDRARA